MSAIDAMSSDNVLSPADKSQVILDVDGIHGEQAGIDDQATSYGVTAEKTAYDNAVTALNTYLATLTTPTAWNDPTGNTTIVGTTFRNTFSTRSPRPAEDSKSARGRGQGRPLRAPRKCTQKRFRIAVFDTRIVLELFSRKRRGTRVPPKVLSLLECYATKIASP